MKMDGALKDAYAKAETMEFLKGELIEPESGVLWAPIVRPVLGHLWSWSGVSFSVQKSKQDHDRGCLKEWVWCSV